MKLCLNSIKQTTAELKPELIIVDSGGIKSSQRELRDIIEVIYPEAKILTFQANLGYSRGVNIGIQQSTGKYILILNPDIVVFSNAIATLVNYLKSHPDVGLIGPKLLNFNGSVQQSYFSYYRLMTILVRRSFVGKFKPFKKVLTEFLMTGVNPDEVQTPDWLMGSALLTSRAALDKVGLMDELFFMYFEDVDWARRFWHNGYKVVYFPKAVMYHYHQRESKSRFGLWDVLFNKKTRWHIRSAFKFFKKYRNLVKTN